MKSKRIFIVTLLPLIMVGCGDGTVKKDSAPVPQAKGQLPPGVNDPTGGSKPPVSQSVNN